MTAHNLTLSIPEALFDRIKVRADERSRSIAEETLDLLGSAVPNETLSEDLMAAVASLRLLDDAELWNVARSHFAADAASLLESLNLKQQRDGLTAGERETKDHLVRQYERAMLVRAHAASLLQQRGHNLAELGPTQ